MVGNWKCFLCDKQGNMEKDCLKRGAQRKSTDRFYTIDTKKAKGNNELIVGTYHRNDQPCFVLFDCGATHSFISTKCAQHLGLEAVPMKSPMVVTTATGSSVETQWICEDCRISVNGWVFVYHSRILTWFYGSINFH